MSGKSKSESNVMDTEQREKFIITIGAKHGLKRDGHFEFWWIGDRVSGDRCAGFVHRGIV